MTDTQAPGSSTPIVPTATGLPGSSTPVAAPAPAGAPASAPVPAEAPAPAPAPAPAEPLKVETGTDDKGKAVFSETGHAGLDMSLAFLGKHGFGPGHPGMAAAVNGDFSILRAQLAEKNVPGSEAYIALAEKAYEELHAKHEAQRAADKEALHGLVGGEEQWNAVKEWGKTNASEEQSKVINEMLGMGGEHMKIAASWLAGAYTKATGGEAPLKETDGAGPRVADFQGKPVVSTDALSPQEYGRAVSAARNAHKHSMGDFETSPAYLKLQDRRSRYKG